MPRRHVILLVAALLGAALVAGCAEPAPDESAAAPPQDIGDATAPPDTDAAAGGADAAACADEVGAPGGYGSTGATRPGQVGTGTGDIGSDLACPPASETG